MILSYNLSQGELFIGLGWSQMTRFIGRNSSPVEIQPSMVDHNRAVEFVGGPDVLMLCNRYVSRSLQLKNPASYT